MIKFVSSHGKLSWLPAVKVFSFVDAWSWLFVFMKYPVYIRPLPSNKIPDLFEGRERGKPDAQSAIRAGEGVALACEQVHL